MTQLDRSPAFLTSDDFIRSNEIIRTKYVELNSVDLLHFLEFQLTVLYRQ